MIPIYKFLFTNFKRYFTFAGLVFKVRVLVSGPIGFSLVPRIVCSLFCDFFSILSIISFSTAFAVSRKPASDGRFVEAVKRQLFMTPRTNFHPRLQLFFKWRALRIFFTAFFATYISITSSTKTKSVNWKRTVAGRTLLNFHIKEITKSNIICNFVKKFFALIPESNLLNFKPQSVIEAII